MEPPSSFDPERIRDEIVKVFRSLHAYSEKEMDSLIVRGQYQGYRNEQDVSPTSNTETYVAMTLLSVKTQKEFISKNDEILSCKYNRKI